MKTPSEKLKRELRRSFRRAVISKVTALELIEIVSGSLVSLVAVGKKPEICQEMARRVLLALENEFASRGWMVSGPPEGEK